MSGPTLPDVVLWLREVATWLRECPFGDASWQARECERAAVTVERCATDSQRLDWLEANDALLNHAEGMKPHVCVHWKGENIHFYGASYREAIDNAMEGWRS